MLPSYFKPKVVAACENLKNWGKSYFKVMTKTLLDQKVLIFIYYWKAQSAIFGVAYWEVACFSV